ncbi:excalibur calcium-binding domain-containing protein [Streptomyces sp. ADI95-16]|uniref:excalibur calcium-binding domain-containing protein n=1 Tax=Streptomyces sp. ADI95-16 TaxID=1522758 RepID=UPI000F3A9019|nr:excalibur calcium-binding domain-containing protein [Streptomyces sp. ADI95-16]
MKDADFSHDIGHSVSPARRSRRTTRRRSRPTATVTPRPPTADDGKTGTSDRVPAVRGASSPGGSSTTGEAEASPTGAPGFGRHLDRNGDGVACERHGQGRVSKVA